MDKTCNYCGSLLVVRENWYPDWHRQGKRQCMPCYNKWRRENEPYSTLSRGNERKRRAKPCGHVECKRIVRPEVLRRGRGKCGVCGSAINSDSWDADHIVPISKGGEHCYHNLQPSHPSCNRSKGDSLAQ